MKSFLKFIFVFVVILLLSAVFAPLLFKILPYKFERIFNRLVMIFSLAAVIIAVKRGFFRFPAEAMRPTKERFAMLGASFATGFFILVSMSIIKIIIDVVDPNIADKTALGWINLFFMSTLSAFIIGIIEEWFFRGFIFTALREQRRLPLVWSLIITNVFYSLIHFIGGRKPFIDQTPNFFDSLKLIYTPLLSLTQWETILPGAIGLFIFGVILSLLYLQTGSLYPCIGLHAGCVFFLKLDGSFFFQREQSPLLLGTSHNYDGFMGWIFLIVMGLILVRIMRRFGYRFGASLALIAVFFLVLPSPSQAKTSSWEVFFENEEGKDKIEQNDEPQAAGTLSPLSPPSGIDASSEPNKRTAAAPDSDNGFGSPQTETGDPTDRANNPISSFSIPDDMAAGVQAEEAIQESTQAEAPSERSDSAVHEERSMEAPKSTMEKAALSAVLNETAGGIRSEGRAMETLVPEKISEPVSRKEINPQPFVLRETAAIKAKEETRPLRSVNTGPHSPSAGEDFIFYDFLQDAAAYEVKEDAPVIKGVWDKNGFAFPGSEENSIIRVDSAKDSDANRKYILISGVPGTTRRLVFPEVRANSVLRLSYRLPQAAQGAQDKAASVYLKVWVGRYPLKRISLTASGAWIEENLEMGVVQFLKEPVPVTLDLVVSGQSVIPVGLDARIEQTV